jgi:phage shock protein PspC (stress-responsive transcriptional regulator)
MNKTVTINISGIIFHIEEDAYEKLSRYLGTIRGYFSDSDGRDEIMTDIEARIAEMLQEKVSQSKQVVLMADVDHVISVMGQPEEFAAGTDESYGQTKKEEPQENYTRTGRKRIFRDPDDKMLGGVCSGVAAYTNTDPTWIRIAFVIAALISFGTWLLIYVLLWIIIPEARTTAEKLEMRGENVNVNNISKAVNEEMEEVRKRMESFGKEMGSKETRDRARNGIDSILEFLGSFFKVIGKILAVIFIAIGTVLLVFLLSSLFGATNIVHIHHGSEDISYSLKELAGTFFSTEGQMDLMLTGVILLVAIPLISLIYLGIRLLFKVKEGNRISLWMAGWVLVVIAGLQVGREFSEKATHTQELTIQQPAGDTLYLKVRSDKKYDFSNNEMYDSRVIINDWNIVDVDEKKLVFGFPRLDIVESETDSFQLIVKKTANGLTKKEATIRNKNITYNFYQVDSLLEFSPYFDIDTEDKFRGQEVRLVLKVPKGKVIFLHKNMRNIIYDIDNVMDAWDGDMVNRRWIMTPEGLDCIDCQGLEDRRTKIEIRHNEVPVPPAPPGSPGAR